MSGFTACKVLICALSLATPAGVAQGVAPRHVRTFTVSDGLAHDIVRDVLHTKDGSVWLATMGGLTRYDPVRCRFSTMDWGPRNGKRSQVMAVVAGAEGDIWVATLGGGIGRFKPGAGSGWRWYGQAQGLPDEYTALLFDSKGRLWATPTGGGMVLYDGARWHRHGAAEGLLGGELGSCSEQRSGAILCGSYGRPALQQFRDRWRTIPVNLPNSKFYPRAALEGPGGKLWLATKGAGVIVGTPTAGAYVWNIETTARALMGSRVGAISRAHDGTLWFSSSRGASGVKDGRWIHVDRKQGLANSHVFAIREDSQGGLWFATLGGGVTRFSRSRWTHYDQADGLPSESLSGGILLDGASPQHLWVGTSRGLALGNRLGKAFRFSRVAALAHAKVNHLIGSRRGGIWVAANRSIWHVVRPGRATALPGIADPCPPSQPNCSPTEIRWLAEGRDGTIWAATTRGVARWQGPNWKLFTADDGLPDNNTNSVVVANEEVWAATDQGLARLRGTRWVPEGPADSARRSRKNRIYRLAVGRTGTVWASGLIGVQRLMNGSWTAFSTTRWLPAGIYSRYVMTSSDGSVWFAVRGLGIRRYRAGRWASFDTHRGLAGDTVRDVIVLKDGSVLFATLGAGLSQYSADTSPPDTFFSPAGSTPPSRHVVVGEEGRVSFSGLDVLKDTPTDELLFSRRIDGGRWTPFGQRRRFNLATLAAGKHTLDVRAMDRDLNVDPSPASLTVVVLPRWWQRPWLLGLVVSALAALFCAFFWITRAVARERRALREQQEAVDQRKRFVRLASHELRKPLTRLAHRAELLSMDEFASRKDKVAEYAAAIGADSKHLARLVESLLEQAKLEREQLRLDPKDCDLRALVEDALTNVLGEAPGPRLESGESLHARVDPLYLAVAVGNLADNAAKYGGDMARARVCIDQPVKGMARITVQDEGPGVSPEESEAIFQPFHRGRTKAEHGGFGLGLPFARDIARAHGGDLVITPTDRGCRFELTCPLEGPESKADEV